VALSGPLGTTWRNWTREPWYQCLASLRKPCARCLRRNGHISPRPWPQLHPHCECQSVAIAPGAEAYVPFRSMGQLMPLLDPAGRAAIVGAELVLLERAGLVSWDDCFGDDGEVLELGEVVRRRGLTYAQLVAAGLDESSAGRAAPGR
jgi:hypothetical protein